MGRAVPTTGLSLSLYRHVRVQVLLDVITLDGDRNHGQCTGGPTLPDIG